MQYESTAKMVREKHAEIFKALEPLREFRSEDVKKQIDEISELLVRLNLKEESAKGTTQQLEQKKEEVAAYLLSEINVSALDSAIIVHGRSARQWLIILLISAIIAFRVAWWVNVPDDKILWWWGPMFPQPKVPLTYLEAFVNLGRKVLLLSAAFAVPLLALRVYYANLHNLVVNRQRKISMIAFTKLYELMKDSDPSTKAELVKQAALTIFTQGTTGFPSKQRPYPELVELLRPFLQLGSKK